MSKESLTPKITYVQSNSSQALIDDVFDFLFDKYFATQLADNNS